MVIRTAAALLLGVTLACTADEGSPSGDTSSGEATTIGPGDLETGASTVVDDADDGDSTTAAEEPPVGGKGSPCDAGNPNCPDGFKCMPVFKPPEFEAQCAPVPEAPLSPGDPCPLENPLFPYSPDDPCDETSVCFSVGGDLNEGLCLSFCPMGHDDCVLPGDVCIVGFGGHVRVCSQECDPLADDCLEGGGCYTSPPELDTFVCAPQLPGAGQYGTLCDGQQLLCQSGNACYPDTVVADGCEGQWCCTPYCDTSSPNECPGADQGEVCFSPYQGNPPPGKENLGVCALPL